MAAEVPVKDVLCEAMEYLSKLGSNLRTRTENLKEKKIRKDKLSNVLAVQKAANKVLLICELSKKSLENVENGIRQVLQHVDASQSQSKSPNIGGKTSHRDESKNDNEKPKYYYIEYKSRKLRMKRKINLRHYTSVKVTAKNIPLSELQNYPVHYDCKLYRQRRRTEKSAKCKDQEIKTDSDMNTDKPTSNSDKAIELSVENEEVSLTKQNAEVNLDKVTDTTNEKEVCITEEKIHKSSENHSNEKNNKNIDSVDDTKVHQNKDVTSKTDKHDDTELVDSSSKNRNVERDNKCRKRIYISDSSDNESIKKSKLNSKQRSPKKRKLNDSENESSEDVIETTSTNVVEKNLEDSEKITEETKDRSSDPETKPLIKCVSLSKLLKPSVLQKENLITSKERNPKDKRSISLVQQKEKRDRIKQKTEDDYWLEKRREVKEFKAKKFSIKIERCPKLSEEFLKEHKIKRVIQKGEVVFDLEKPKDSAKTSKKNIENCEINNEILSEANKIKNALLNQSDSESDMGTKNKNTSDSESFKSVSGNDSEGTRNSKNDENCDNDQNTVKNAQQSERLPESNTQTECDAQPNVNVSETENAHKQLDKSKSDDHIERSPEKTVDMQNQNEKSPEKSEKSPSNEEEIAKNSLLNESSDDKTNTPLKERKERKKHMRESIKAKKMLLTYSSSSETEDEQLRDAIKEIKDSLLKDMSDEDNNLKEKVSENIRDKSDSSDSDVNIKRKKAKLNSSSDSTRRKMVRSKSKPGNCSSQNSDTQDVNDKHIDGLTNLNTLNKTRRRNSNDSNTRSNNTDSGEGQEDHSSANEGKPGDLGEYFESTGIIDNEVILGAESDSDVESGGENHAGEEDLPTVPVSGFNGDPMQHLVKEDLLGESDSSVSHNEKSSENANKDDTDEENKLNSKRRKANAISSDSEAGSSRKKDQNVKMSDFEDSEDDGSDIVKKPKRKKKGVDSDSSASSNEGGKKKRRRIKQVNDSDGSGSETETEGRNKHGRKNIRKVMGKNQLEEATKKAARQEKERIARIAERQKLYNNLEFDESGKPDEVVLEKVVLDFDPETKEPLIQVDRGLVKKLKPHQANGIKFMWDACFESVKRIKKDKGSGCILAHCMGLGKTLQVVSLTHTLLTHSSLTKVNRVLVVCPLSTVLNWVNEFRMWLKHAETDYEVDVYELSRFKQNSERAFQLSQWFAHGGVCVLGYEMFRNLSADNSKKFKKKMLKNFQESLVDPGPDLVVCDEGHLLKNEKTSLSQSMNRVKTLRRIVLTGTPLQNNLKEYYCMVQFVKPNLLGKYNEYLNRFVNPITNGQYTDSTEHDIKIMKRRSHVLHKMLDGAVQRRDYGVLAPFLPPKHEYVLFITLTEVQIKLYQYYLDNFSRRPLPGKSSGFLFPDFQSLQRIWTHPLVLKYNSERYEIMQQKKREREEEDSEGSLVDFIADDSTPEESSTEESSEDLSDLSDDSRKKGKNKKSSKKNKSKETKVSTRRGTRANPIDHEEDIKDDDVIEVKNENPTEWWIKLVTEDELEDMRNSHKLILLFDILRQCEAIGDKLLVFSQSLYSLDLIEHFLGKVDEATQEGRIDEKLGGHVGSWSPGIDYFRLDGSTSCENRSIWCKNFNREDNPRARLFLISTRAGGLGINLVAANRVVIFDVSWNPSHDVQSIFRVYRFGQKKPCYVYRFLAMGTMEEKIYERQVTKQAISKRVIDEQQIDRHYAENDLAELYKFEARPPSPRPLPPLPKDRLFAEMLKEHEAQIYKYHEHDSLLENKEEETLSEEERKAAWEDFENEKNRPPPAPFPSPWGMHNGMVPNLLQQQQYAYATLAAMLRKDMPNINDNQIRDLLPLLYNANSTGSMQKMNDLFKYSQMGMMNPGMMNPMNSASGTGSMGGTSGLQYEPPWQRQQQQQQQMRLQQLIQQQQNQMGAKLYAGGLGSRDPVAMALQQQRAREIMLGGATGRPRGRPPLQPRAPLPAHDIVNLDSD